MVDRQLYFLENQIQPEFEFEAVFLHHFDDFLYLLFDDFVVFFLEFDFCISAEEVEPAFFVFVFEDRLDLLLLYNLDGFCLTPSQQEFLVYQLQQPYSLFTYLFEVSLVQLLKTLLKLTLKEQLFMIFEFLQFNDVLLGLGIWKLLVDLDHLFQLIVAHLQLQLLYFWRQVIVEPVLILLEEDIAVNSEQPVRFSVDDRFKLIVLFLMAQLKQIERPFLLPIKGNLSELYILPHLRTIILNVDEGALKLLINRVGLKFFDRKAQGEVYRQEIVFLLIKWILFIVLYSYVYVLNL